MERRWIVYQLRHKWTTNFSFFSLTNWHQVRLYDTTRDNDTTKWIHIIKLIIYSFLTFSVVISRQNELNLFIRHRTGWREDYTLHSTFRSMSTHILYSNKFQTFNNNKRLFRDKHQKFIQIFCTAAHASWWHFWHLNNVFTCSLRCLSHFLLSLLDSFIWDYLNFDLRKSLLPYKDRRTDRHYKNHSVFGILLH